MSRDTQRRRGKEKERKGYNSRKARAARRAKKQRESTDVQKALPEPTANAKTIKALMISKKVKGHYKDYVIITGNRLVDWQGTFNITVDDGYTLGVDGLALIHKKRLHMIIGDEQAKRFWHPQLGRIVEVPEGTKKST
jgi:hypothetical protein